ncbi:MAG: hypothetical protein QNJ55_11975 [Xenococcus sp. MO_188.B8]|nr:hypothetical protein [Xenococcus sp. MO_188.B8]
MNLSIASAQENSQSLNQPSENDRQSEPITTTRTRESSSIFEAIWKLLKAKKEQEPALSSRSNICEVTPGLLGETNLIYSDRPLFLWQGMIPQVDIYLYTPFSLDTEQEVFWSQTVASNNRILYSGEPLQPGQIYDWEIVVDSATNRRRISFQVMEAAERDRISRELEQIKSELTISGATSEEIILAKANYFAEKDLWSDSLQQLSFLETASGNAISPEMRQFAIANNQEMISFICQSEPTK